MPVKLLSWGPRRTFVKKWLGGDEFQDEPLAVRQAILQNGSYGEAPDEETWERVTKRKIQSQVGGGAKSSAKSTIPEKRLREDDETEVWLKQSTSSNEDRGDDDASQGLSKQLKQSNEAHSRRVASESRLPLWLTRDARPSVGSMRDQSSSSGSSSSGEFEFESKTNSNSEATYSEPQSRVHTTSSSQALPPQSRLTSNSTPVTEKSQSSAIGVIPNPQSSSIQPTTSNPQPHHASVSADRPRQSDIGALTPTTNDSASAPPNGASISSSSNIKFKLIVPRTKMVRYLHVEDEEDSPEYIFSQARDFFRRYDRLVGTPVLECFIDGDPECICIYNARELRHFMEELRKRGGAIKVKVMQSA